MDHTKEIVVDLWKTGAHGVEMGIKKDAEHQAKSRQFTKDMDIFGDITEDGKEAGYIAFRTDPWNEEIPNKRIVIKTFSKKMNWKSSLEEIVSRGIANSLAAEEGLPVFMINLNREDYLIYFEKGWRLTMGKSIYTFSILDEKTLINYSYVIETDRLSMGDDWFVYDHSREKIAEIDGKKFNVGGKFVIKINAKAPSYISQLDEVLILFAGLNRFLKKVEKKMKKTIDALKDDPEFKVVVQKDEAMLYLNPRRVKV